MGKEMKPLKTFVAKKDLGEGYRTEYRVKAEDKQTALEKIREIS